MRLFATASEQYTALFVGYVLLLMMAAMGCYWTAERKPAAETILFWLFGLILVAFTALRPFGIGFDDGVYYALHYSSLCPITECLNAFHQSGDTLWYLAISVIKVIWPTHDIMLWLAAVGFLAKLLIIQDLSRFRLFSLLIYVCLFYQTHDMTTYRQTLSEVFFLLGVWLMVRSTSLRAAPVLAMSGFAHKQAYFTPLVLLGPWIIRRWYHLHGVIVISFLLMWMGWSLEAVVQLGNAYKSQLPSLLSNLVTSLGTGFYGKPKGLSSIQLLPSIYYPTVAWVLWEMRGPWPQDRLRLYSVVAYCVALAYFLLSFFSGLEVIQYRLFYYYLMPIVLVAGGARLSRMSLLAGLLLSGLYMVKYNILHETFLTPVKLIEKVEGKGEIHRSKPWVSCGESCYEFGLGSTLELEAKPSPGYRFDAWGGDCESSHGVCALAMDADKQVKAFFAPVFALSMKSGGEGMVSVMPYASDTDFDYFNELGGGCSPGCQTVVDAAQKVTLTATAYAGYHFVRWYGACTGITPTCELFVDSDKNITAIFEPDTE
jgi:hypothetical protein